MSKKQQVQRSEIEAGADAEQNKMSEEAAAADAQGTHSNLAEEVATPAVRRFKRTKAVAMPLFKLVADKPLYILVDSAMYVGKKIDDKKEAATLLNVTDLDTGEQGMVIVGTVLKSLIEENYPADGYVGKHFELTLRKRADKKYNTYDLYEVEGE